MSQQEQRDLVRQVSCYLGMVAKTMMQNESVIDSAIQAITERLEVDPQNIAAPMMLKLLQGSKEMILAHKSMMKYGAALMTGSCIIDPPDTVQ